jgi:hypothetical protein
VKVASSFFPSPSAVDVATGTDFADGEVAGVVAAITSAPLLLTLPDRLPPPVVAYLATQPTVATIRVFGGTTAVSDHVVDQLGG